MLTTASLRRRPAAVIVGALLALATVALAAFLLFGGRFQAVTTPSMAEAAPVGTLVLTVPGTPEVGDIITFTPEGMPHSYTHRVVGISDRGYTTKGDLNGSVDPWTVAPDQVAGVAWLRWWTFGWIARALPIIALGALITYLVTRFLFSADFRHIGRVMGGTLTVAVASLLLRPWTGVQLIGYSPAADGITASVVSTGILPLRVTARGGTSVDLVNGRLGTISTQVGDGSGKFNFDPSLHLTLGWLLILIAACLVPFLLCLAEFRRDTPRPNRTRKFRIALPAAAVGVVALITALLVVPTLGAFGASIRNSTDTAASRTWFSCKNAETGTAGLLQAYAMGTNKATTQANLAGGTASVWNVTTTSQTNYGCLRDTPRRTVTFNGTSQCLSQGAATTAVAAPSQFSIEVWFKTTSAGTGKLIGFGNQRTIATTNDSSYDRHVYVDPAGRLVFGIRSNGTIIISSPNAVNDGSWHHMIATLGGAGMRLYLDGEQVAANQSQTAAASTGFWKIGCGNLTGWRAADGSAYSGPSYFTGQMQYAAIYNTQLSAAQVLEHFQAGDS